MQVNPVHTRRHRQRENELRDGGELYALVADGASRKDLRGGFAAGTRFAATWQKVEDPEGQVGEVFDSAPDAAIIARGEGAWYDSGKIYFVSTSGGAAGMGQVWMYDPDAEELTLSRGPPPVALLYRPPLRQGPRMAPVTPGVWMFTNNQSP